MFYCEEWPMEIALECELYYPPGHASGPRDLAVPDSGRDDEK